MGTPDAAVGCLEATVAWADETVVFTQPDRPSGRSHERRASPVKARAVALGLPVRQPERLRGDAATLDWLRAFAPDLIVVVAYAQILPREVLEVPRLGCVNVHFSLLPAYRGAAPVQWALIRGETETGLSTMRLDAGLDTGPILLQQRTAIGPEETAGELTARLAAAAPSLLQRTLEGTVDGSIIEREQDSSAATLAPKLTPDDGWLDWTRPAPELLNRVRGVTPWPGARAVVAGETVKVLRAGRGDGDGRPGTVLATATGRGILMATGAGAVWLREVQAPGRRPMPGEAYARGRQDWASRLEAESKES